MLEVRRMLLEHFGYIVLPSTSVEDAKSLAKHECPDMLLMDNSHPGIDFEEIAKQIKRICPDVITVVLSPFYGMRHPSDGIIDRFVPKDDGPDILISQLGEIFEERLSGESAESAQM
jgi:CheY-like chemotaxis protein